ncbi:hypothetical protein U9M48_011907 [Paspalum notatum var. saurae]|uniref:Uncharacterized protein n=1 Tax=Paspalum notatum var. saurae TaxID=547442 RepID=A0AAQ3WI22_PASNO
MEGAAQTLLSNAGQLLSKEYKQLRGSEAEDGAVDRFVQVCMKQLRELAYDAEDCIDMYRLRIKSRPISDGIRSWSKHLLSTLFARRRLACDIRDLRARAVAISERQARFGVNREALRRSPPLLPAPMPAAATTPANDADRRHQLVGIAEQANALAARLKEEPVGEKKGAAVFSIVGFGGLGKTTLATEVCRLLEAEFPFQAMVSVSQAFQPNRDIKVLLKGLLQQLIKPKTANERGIKEEGALGQIDGLDDIELAKQLNELLTDERFIIVIDDVWTIQAWYSIQSKLPDNSKGGRIIVTTRIETVAKACSPGSVTGRFNEVKPLKIEYSRKLFLSIVFGSVDASCPEEFKDVMEDILKKCGGMPLAIVSVASVLARYKSPGSNAKWDMVCKSIGSQMESHPTLEGMRHILTLSYNHLPHELKCCMMYFSIFPEDYVIARDRLLNRWIAEGLVCQKRGLSVWEVAQSYLDELLSRNLIEQAGYFLDIPSSEPQYRVHDMLLEVMVSKSLEANFVSLQGGKYDRMFYDKARRLSIHGDVDSVDYPSSKTKATIGRQGEYDLNMQHVRSLTIFHLQGHKLLNQLGNFTLLRVLDLQDCEAVTNKHVKDACNLKLLRFLRLNGTKVSKVPRRVKNLQHLQILDLEDTLLLGLPNAVTELEKLESLWFYNMDDFWHILWTIPQGLSKMKALRILGRVCIGNDSRVARELGELEQLKDLDLSLDDRETIFSEDVLRDLAMSLCKLHSLRWLSIGCLSDGGKILNFLHHLPTPPRLIQHMWITSDMDGLPSWIGSLTHLASFIIERTTLTDDQLFGVLCKLHNLKSLCVSWSCYSDRDELVARSSHKFPVLRDLNLRGYVPKALCFEEGSMAALETLDLVFDLRSAHVEERSINGIEQLTNLKKVTLDGEYNPTSSDALLEQLKNERERRSRSNQQFQIIVKYT